MFLVHSILFAFATRVFDLWASSTLVNACFHGYPRSCWPLFTCMYLLYVLPPCDLFHNMQVKVLSLYIWNLWSEMGVESSSVVASRSRRTNSLTLKTLKLPKALICRSSDMILWGSCLMWGSTKICSQHSSDSYCYGVIMWFLASSCQLDDTMMWDGISEALETSESQFMYIETRIRHKISNMSQFFGHR